MQKIAVSADQDLCLQKLHWSSEGGGARGQGKVAHLDQLETHVHKAAVSTLSCQIKTQQ